MKTNHPIRCSMHTEHNITNYCCLMRCQTPLCPECIDKHNKRHKSNGVFPMIDTLHRVTKMCDQKCELVIQDIQHLLDQVNSFQRFDIDHFKKQAQADLERMKQTLFTQISAFFDNMLKDFNAKISNSVKKVVESV